MKINAVRALTGAIVIVVPIICIRPVSSTPSANPLSLSFSRVLSFLQEDHWTRQRQSHPKQRQTLQA
jgi:hypothetical protein